VAPNDFPRQTDPSSKTNLQSAVFQGRDTAAGALTSAAAAAAATTASQVTRKPFLAFSQSSFNPLEATTSCKHTPEEKSETEAENRSAGKTPTTAAAAAGDPPSSGEPTTLQTRLVLTGCNPRNCTRIAIATNHKVQILMSSDAAAKIFFLNFKKNTNPTTLHNSLRKNKNEVDADAQRKQAKSPRATKKTKKRKKRETETEKGPEI
jgi:hypothetical protein